jgi:hypothetical protein
MCCAGAVQVLELYYMKTGDERFDDAAHELNQVRRHFLCTIAPPSAPPMMRTAFHPNTAPQTLMHPPLSF